MSQTFHELTVSDVVRETPSAVSLRFNIPEEFKKEFAFEAGQYLTIKLSLNGEEQRRSYSISSAQKDEALQVSVKEVKGGIVSPFLTKTVQKGDVLMVSPPEGKFTIEWNENKGRAYYFIAAGSGITPIMSMLKTGLEREPRSSFFLLYGNRHKEDVMFASELEQLQLKYAGQFRMLQTFSGEKDGFFKKIFSNKKEDGSWKGRIDGKKLKMFLDQCPANKMECHYFICGPGDMIQNMEEKLTSMGVDGKSIHKEYFTADGEPKADAGHFKEAGLVAQLDGQTYTVTVPKGKTVLDVLIEAGADPPYSCTSGVCSTCAAKVTKGKVEMDTCLALDDSEIEEGLVLTCQAHPVTEELELTYDID
jgi:ring-1,2-phenylacetyl-CoA epoxidase subunit PaaE